MERSKLRDFNPYDTGLIPPIEKLFQEYGEKDLPQRKSCDRDTFLALLSGVAALRKTPGIPGPDRLPLTHLPRCAAPEDAKACRAHLEKIFGITDLDSLLEFCTKEIWCHNNYLDFEGFWEGRPPFDTDQLKKQNESAFGFFQVLRDFSAQFYELVGHRGYLAWDISECVGHLRNAFACGLITREEFDELAEHWLEQAQIFKSWKEFAVSLVCGELYWDFRQGSRLPELHKGLELWSKLVSILLDDETAWGSGLWYVPPRKKEFLLWAPEMKNYLPGWKGPDGCMASDHITVLGKKVGWCYREQPEPDVPDSGWRFFSGEESEEYTDSPDHIGIVHLNTVCNYDPDVLPLLHAPIGTGYIRGEDGKFHEEKFTPPEG